MKKKFLTFLTMLFVLAFASVAVAAIPTLSRDRYLVTKIYSSSSIPVFTNANLNVQGTAVPQKAYKASIDPNDDIYVFNYSGNSWAYVSYPTSSGRREGYIRMSDLTPNNHWQDPQRARSSMSTYTRPGGAKYGSISNGDTVHTIAAINYRFQVVYPINNGRQYKMAWVTDADYFGYIAPSSSPSPTPAPAPTPAPSGKLLYPLKGKSISYSSSRTTNGQRCDYVAPSGTAIYAPADGTVKFMQSYAKNYGKLASYANQILFTSSDNKYTVRCAHLSSFNGVSLKYTQSLSYPCSADTYSCSTITLATKNVKRGDLLGYTGMTGNASGPHLHLEVKENGRAVAPVNVFTTW